MLGQSGEKRRFTRWQKALALVPLAVLAGAWTTSFGSSSPPTAEASQGDDNIPSVPTTAFHDPASVTVPPTLDPEVLVPGASGTTGDTPADADPSSESANGIPDAALAAYQRAEAVLNQADDACNLPWELIAAIGRVESDHGRYGGNVLGDDGVSTPGIFGIPLDGTHGTALIDDTDSGSYDNDTVYDRAVGPMQFIPGTWEIVGVDGDADGERNPQDIDDAALAAGVYLCAGENDLSSTAGQTAAVFSYNNSDDYVALVLSIMRSYEAGNFTSVENGLPSNASLPGEDDKPRHHKPRHHKPRHHGHHGGGNNPGGGGGNPNPGGGGGDNPNPGGGGGGNPNPGGGGGGGNNPTGPITKPVEDTVDPVVEATNKCLAAFAEADIDPSTAQLNECIAAFQAGGMAAVNNLINDLLDLLDGLPLPDLPGLPGPPGG